LVDDGQEFFRVLHSIVMVLRQLRRTRVAWRKCLTEQSHLDFLVNFHRPRLSNVPHEEGDAQANVQKYEEHLRERHEQEEDLDKEISKLNCTLDNRMRRMDGLMNAEVAPDSLPPSLKDNANFRETYKYCRSLAHTFRDLEVKGREAEQERETILDRYYSHAERELPKKVVGTESQAGFDEVDPHKQALRDCSGPHTQHLKLEQDASRTKMMCYVQKSALATLLDNDLVKRGELEPHGSDGEEPESQPDNAEQQKASKQAEVSASEKTKPQHDALIAEPLSAQGHLCDAEEAFKNSRNLTEEEFSNMPGSITEDQIGVELWLKLVHTTRNYTEAQDRVRRAQAEGRRLGVPMADRFTRDQTWDFEDRSDDGYAESAIAERMEKSKPRVEAWLPQLAMSGKPLSPSTQPTVPKSLPDLAALRLGDDVADNFQSSGAKERIAKYQKACEALRIEGQFPVASPDRFLAEHTVATTE
jgi:hypothetical protein